LAVATGVGSRATRARRCSGKPSVEPVGDGKEVAKSVQISGAAQATGRTVQITLEDGRLVGNLDERGKQRLIATSEVEFTGLYGLGVQFIDGGLYVKPVSGNYRFARK
jgi:hypothetical protein